MLSILFSLMRLLLAACREDQELSLENLPLCQQLTVVKRYWSDLLKIQSALESSHGRLLDPLALHPVPEAYVCSAGIVIGRKLRTLSLDSSRKYSLTDFAVDLPFEI